MPKGRGMMMAWGLLAVIFAALAVFYFTTSTSFLASTTGKHTKHAILFLALAVLSLIGVSFARPRASDA